jgi:hypothetical protein
VRVGVRMVVIGMCLSFVTLLGACGSKTAGTASPTPSPSKTLTMQVRAAAYFKALGPVANADEALSAKIAKLPARADATNAFSMAARIDSEYLPAVEQMQAELAAIKPPPSFRVAHARLEEVCALENDVLSFLRDALLRAVHTHTVEPGFSTEANRYVARLDKAMREYGIAVKAAAKRAGLKSADEALPHATR